MNIILGKKTTPTVTDTILSTLKTDNILDKINIVIMKHAALTLG